MERCTHTDQIRDVQPSAQGCEECLEIGDTWVHLRECLVCSHVGCCASSKNKQTTRQFLGTTHPVALPSSRAKTGDGATRTRRRFE